MCLSRLFSFCDIITGLKKEKVTKLDTHGGKFDYRNLIIRAAVTAACCILLFLLVYNDCSSYTKVVAKITSVSGGSVQSITAVVKNGGSAGRNGAPVQQI